MNPDWIKDITVEDLPSQYHEMAKAIGVDNTLKLAELYPKMPFYFVGLETVIKKKKEDYIKSNFTGDNHKALARATGYSERWVYEILKKKEIDDRQEDMFGDD